MGRRVPARERAGRPTRTSWRYRPRPGPAAAAAAATKETSTRVAAAPAAAAAAAAAGLCSAGDEESGEERGGGFLSPLENGSNTQKERQGFGG